MRDKLTTLLKIVVSLGLITIALWRVDLAKVAAQLVSANRWYILLAVLLYTVAIIINGVKWQILLRAQGVRGALRPGLAVSLRRLLL